MKTIQLMQIIMNQRGPRCTRYPGVQRTSPRPQKYSFIHPDNNRFQTLKRKTQESVETKSLVARAFRLVEIYF